MIKEEVIIIDLLAERGHIQFVKNTIKILSLKFNVIFVSSKSYVEIIAHNNFIELDDDLFINDNKYKFFYNQYKLLKRIASIDFDRDSKIIFTGFENITFGLFAKMKRTVFLYIHNNLERKKISTFFFYLINKKHIFFVFEDYIQEYLKSKKRNVISIPHPMWTSTNKINNINNKEEYIFAPNVNPHSRIFEKLVEFASKNNLKIYVKYNKLSKPKQIKNVLIKPFYENYSEVVQNARYVALDILYDYRISGVFYDCMVLNKPIIMLNIDSLFSKNMLFLYNKSILTNLRTDQEIIPNNRDFLNRHKNTNILEIYMSLIKRA